MKHRIEIEETVDAKAKLGRGDALRLAAEATTITIAKGKNVVTFSMKDDRPDDTTLLGHMLGPTGNLRAPTIKKGKKLLVGFNEEVYAATI